VADVEVVELVVCAAPLADHAHRLAAALHEAGYDVNVTVSLNAESWVDLEAVARVGAGTPGSTRRPGEPRTRRQPDAVILAPATFNTLNKLRHGISDTPALGVLCDGLGAGIPMLAVPMVNERLAGHPAWDETYAYLAGNGLRFLDAASGTLDTFQPLKSGTGDDVACDFEAALLVRWLGTLS